jgi:hypothetical protein
MKLNQGKFLGATSHPVRQGLLAAAVLTGIAGVTQAAFAQSLLQQEGTLAPVEDAYTFEGEVGQTMTIELQSEEFDTVLYLKGPDGAVLTSNDDYGGTLNSTIVYELPAAGTYSAVASSFSGQGGSYQIEVRPASEYEKVFSRAYDLSVSEDFAGSIEAYTAAIAIDDADPGAYLGRAEARINQAYTNADSSLSGPADFPDEVVEAVVADYLKAADLLEADGQPGPAASLREQAQYFSGEMPEADPAAPDSMPAPAEPQTAPPAPPAPEGTAPEGSEAPAPAQ